MWVPRLLCKHSCCNACSLKLDFTGWLCCWEPTLTQRPVLSSRCKCSSSTTIIKARVWHQLTWQIRKLGFGNIVSCLDQTPIKCSSPVAQFLFYLRVYSGTHSESITIGKQISIPATLCSYFGGKGNLIYYHIIRYLNLVMISSSLLLLQPFCTPWKLLSYSITVYFLF